MARSILLDPGVSLQWLAGYSKTIGWIDSTAMDWCFWNKFFENGNLPDVGRIDETAEFVKKNLAGLCKTLGFRLYRRKGEEVVQMI